MNLTRLSLTTRLTAFYALVSTVVLLGMGLLVTVLVEDHFVEIDQRFLADKVELVADLSSHAVSDEDLRVRLTEALDHHADLRMLVRDKQGTLLFAMPDQRSTEGLDNARAMKAGFVTQGDRAFRTRSIEVTRNYLPHSPLQITAAVDAARHAGFMSGFRRTLSWYGALVAVLSGLLGWWAARRGLAPLAMMRDRALSVTANKLDHRMPVDAVPVEMAALAQSLNQMLERLEQDFHRLSEFSTDIAHELRTPISNLLTQTQVALAQERNAAEYRDILASNAEEFQRLARTVSDMLFLAKAENTRSLPNPELIQLADEVGSLLEFYEALADEKHITFRLEGDASLTADRLMLRRAVSNLLSNALRHADARSIVTVRIGSSPDKVSIAVSNQGPTIDPAVVPRLFDRFFRGDRSRQQVDAEGAGLGLPIVAAILRAHGGTASVRSADHVTEVSLSFPTQT